jgi:hypothetical protein
MISMKQHALKSLEMNTNMASTLCPKVYNTLPKKVAQKNVYIALRGHKQKDLPLLPNNLLLFNLNPQNK